MQQDHVGGVGGMTQITNSTQTVAVGHCDFEAKIKVGGSGSPVLYLHPAGGPRWDRFVETLAQKHTVYAPDHPGTGDTARDSIYKVRNLWDLVLIYDEILDGLGLDAVPVVGTSFGGMMACEIAAHRPSRVSKLVLLDPIGLWRDDAPVTPYMMVSPEQLTASLFHNIDAEPVQEYLKLPSEPKEQGKLLAERIWSMGTTGKFVWPIPDKGLSRRLHRITASTLVIWGAKDTLISPVYADEFAARITGSRVEIIDNAGHNPQLEQLGTVGPLVLDFLAEGKAKERK
jgi:pimeloyl-ACP methyl ester carboxylesterase